MNSDPSKLRHLHREEEIAKTREEQSAAREFLTAEELIRFDLAATPVPPAIAERLSESIAQEPKPRRPWWKRLFS